MKKKSSQRAKKKLQAQKKKAPLQKQPPLHKTPTRRVQLRSKGMRLWLFRFATVFIIPALVLLGLEMGLRVFGYGVPTAFTFRQEIDGERRIISNPYFAWRFLGPRSTATKGTHFSLPPEKAEGTYRIFVLGASAAQGFPAPDHGMARMLHVMLQKQYPGVDFEVINAASPAINSHVVLPIIRDCSHREADLFVIYLGNNEVVGPYGAGTVFSPLVSDLSLIRAGIALKATRLGQLLSATLDKTPGLGRTRMKEFHGMASFINHQVRATDPGMKVVYRHFEENLRDICRVAQNAGIPVIISTVGANLKDSPPFASLHRPGLSEKDNQAYEEMVHEGETLQKKGELKQAVERFLQAEKIDPDYAELHYRLGKCYWAMGDFKKAKVRYRKARELDTLRFRADAEIDEIIRRVASGKAGQGIHFVDALQVLEANSPELTPGNELFYEHVHLNFRGTYLVAQALFEQVQRVLPEWVNHHASGNAILSEEACAQQLVHTGWSRLGIARALLRLMQKPPFSHQLDNVTQVERWSRSVEKLEQRYTRGKGREEVLAQYRAALTGDDIHYLVHDAYAEFQYGVLDNAQEAEKHLKAALRQCPQSVEELFFLSEVLSRQRKQEEAEEYLHRALNLVKLKEVPPAMKAKRRATAAVQWKKLYERAVTLRQQRRYGEGAKVGTQALAVAEREFGKGHPKVAAALSNLATLYGIQGKYAEAEPLYERSLAITEAALGKDHRNVGETLNNLAGLYRAQGKHAKAQPLYERSLAVTETALGSDHPNTAATLSNLAGVNRDQGKYAEAERLYKRSLAIAEKVLGRDHPNVAAVMSNLAWLYQSQEKYAEAERLYRQSLALTEKALGRDHPNVATVLENLAKCSGAMGRLEEAERYGEQARRIRSR